VTKGRCAVAVQQLRASIAVAAHDGGQLELRCSKTESWQPPQVLKFSEF
jgi:hypothetical protein